MGDTEAAFAAIKKARAARPVFPEASAVEGRIYRSEGDIDKALDSFERAIREGKGFQPEAHTGIALILKDEAEAAAADADFDLEKLYYTDAAAAFQKAIDQLSATEPIVYLLLGQIYEKTGEKQKAIAVYQRFLKDFPNDGERSAVESFIVQLRKN
jgi:tetratricopeptide (TPR) repeat protein